MYWLAFAFARLRRAKPMYFEPSEVLHEERPQLNREMLYELKRFLL